MRRLLESRWFREPQDVEARVRNHEAVMVSALPKCDFCAAEATFDGRVKGISSWANMCHVDFEIHGVGLGLGVGQELIVR
jgi:hypothetical protein